MKSVKDMQDILDDILKAYPEKTRKKREGHLAVKCAETAEGAEGLKANRHAAPVP